jgi:putative PIN family toxin of toxin-antitoxin system
MAASADRVVLDTNVLLSGVLFGGRPGKLLELSRSGHIHGVTSGYILGELRRVLAHPRLGISPKLAEDLVLELTAFLEVVPLLPANRRWVIDPQDDLIVETALQGGASMICTGDRRLLEANVPGVRILTVAEVLELVED